MIHHHRIARVAILTLVVAALAVPSASARFSEIGGAPCLSLCNGHGPGATASQPVATPGAPTIVSANSGFDWGDAGIGAGVALVIVATATGGVVMFGRHHAHSRLAS
jgi:hypothetical protein